MGRFSQRPIIDMMRMETSLRKSRQRGMPGRRRFIVTTQPGNKKEMVSYKQDGTVDRKGIYVYDGENNLVAEFRISRRREIVFKRIVHIRFQRQRDRTKK